MRAERRARKTAKPGAGPLWLPAAVGVLLFSLSLGFREILVLREAAALEAKLQGEANYLVSHIEADLRSRLPALRRLARSWELRGELSEAEFHEETRGFLADTPGFQAIEWVDRGGIVRWVEPLEGNAPARGFDLRSERIRRETLDRAVSTGAPAMTPPLDLVQGGTGFLALFPIIQGNGESSGFVLAVFRIHEWLDYVFSLRHPGEYAEDFRIAVEVGSARVYEQGGWAEIPADHELVLATSEVLDQEISILVRPTEFFQKRNQSPLPALALVAGLLLSLLMAGVVGLFQRTLREVWRSRLANEALRASEEQFRLLLESTGEAIYGIDLKGECTFANPACARLLGYPGPEAFLGKNMHDLIHHSWADGKPMPVEVCRIFRAFREGLRIHVDDEVLWRADGSSFPAEYWSYPQISEGRVEGAVVTFLDISERRRSEEMIRHMATHDGLTDLPTLRLFRDRLGMAMGLSRRNQSFAAVLFIDLDGFKAVNDSRGHDAGDAVLREVAARLGATVRATDTVCRMGGDEFLLALSDVKEPDLAARVAEKLLEALARPIPWQEAALAVQASVGIAIYPRDGEEIDLLIKRADAAMYAVKGRGKNGFAFWSADLGS